MTDTKFDVLGIGNAIVDIIGRADDAFLEAHGAPKGHMRLVDADEVARLYDAMGPATEISGGSAANTMVGIAGLGGRAAFIGKVADDEFGHIFAHDIKAAGVTFETAPSNGNVPTARSLILVTPDGERTMNTFLGVSPDFTSDDLDEKLIRESAVIYLEGYLFDRDAAKSAFMTAANQAKAAGRKVALTLSDGFCVDRHRQSFLELIRNGVDILFANEDEISALYETASFDEAVARAATDARLAVVTRSEKGCVVVEGGERTAAAAFPVDEVVDTTGAGDLFAAGFLYGHARGLNHETAARIGGLAASEIISHVGARPETDLAVLAQQRGLIG